MFRLAIDGIFENVVLGIEADELQECGTRFLPGTRAGVKCRMRYSIPSGVSTSVNNSITSVLSFSTTRNIPSIIPAFGDVHVCSATRGPSALPAARKPCEVRQSECLGWDAVWLGVRREASSARARGCSDRVRQLLRPLLLAETTAKSSSDNPSSISAEFDSMQTIRASASVLPCIADRSRGRTWILRHGRSILAVACIPDASRPRLITLGNGRTENPGDGKL